MSVSEIGRKSFYIYIQFSKGMKIVTTKGQR